MSSLTFSISGESQSATKFEAKARNFSFVVDEPESLGGNDHGPNPVEYLLGSYAGCLNVVVHLVAKEEGININKLNIAINGDLDPAKFVGQPGFNRASSFRNGNYFVDSCIVCICINFNIYVYVVKSCTVKPRLAYKFRRV